MPRLNFLCIGLILSGLGCRVNTNHHDMSLEPVRFVTDTLDSFRLEGEIFSNSDILGFPFSIAVGEARVYVLDRNNSTSRSLLVFDRNTGNFLLSAVNKGEGPQEMDGLRSLDFKPHQDSGWLYDSPQRKMQFFEGDSLTNHIIRLEDSGFAFGAVMTTGDSIASAGMHVAGRLAIHSPTGELARYIGPDPLGDPNIPIPVRNHSYQSWLTTNSDGSRVVLANWYTDQIEIFGEFGLLHWVQGPGFHDPQFTVHGDQEGNSWLSIDDETTIGYLSVDATDKNIFALYCGRTMGWSRATGTGTAWGNRVIVFDWTGVPQAILYVEDGAIKIGVSGSGDELYVIYHRPVPLILRYELPELG